jgi:hypothetical protein
MEPKFQSSFIPKGPLATTATVSSSVSKVSERGLLGFLSTIVFIFTVVVAAGVFAYGFYLSSSISKMGSDLDSARTTLNPDSIKELTQLNSRLTLTAGLLNNHTVLSPLFDFLEASTLQSVRFTEFRYEDTDKGLRLNMKGLARGYSAIALQADILEKSKYIKDPVFSDLSLDDKGNVTFTFSALLDPSVVSYSKQIESIPVVTPIVTPPVSPVNASGSVVSTSTGTTTRPVNQSSTTTPNR